MVFCQCNILWLLAVVLAVVLAVDMVAVVAVVVSAVRFMVCLQAVAEHQNLC
jgi:hypothetical protein